MRDRGGKVTKYFSRHVWSPIQTDPNYIIYFAQEQENYPPFVSLSCPRYTPLGPPRIYMKGILEIDALPSSLTWSPLLGSVHDLPLGLWCLAMNDGLVGLINPLSFIEKKPSIQVSTNLGSPLSAFDFHPTHPLLVGASRDKVYAWDLDARGLEDPVLVIPKEAEGSDEPVWLRGPTWGGNTFIYGCPSAVKCVDVRQIYQFNLGIVTDYDLAAAKLVHHPFREYSIILGSTNHEIPICEEWDIRYTSCRVKEFFGHTMGLNSMDCSPLTGELLTCSTDGQVICWDTDSGNQIFSMAGWSGIPIDVAWSRCMSHVYSVFLDSQEIEIFFRCYDSEFPYEPFVPTPDLLDTDYKDPYIIPKTPIIPKTSTITHLTPLKMEHFYDIEKRQEVVDTFCQQMKNTSYALLTLSDDDIGIIRFAEEIQKKFFLSGEPIKSEIAIHEGRDIGYKHNEDIKEFFQMRLANVPTFPWPREPENFSSAVSAVWNLLSGHAKTLLESLGVGLGVSPQKMACLLDPEIMDPDQFSHSIMGLYNYYPHEKETETCQIHKDMGLISLIPCADVSGLEVLDYQIFKWVEIERLSNRNNIICIGSQTLDRLTSGYYPSCIHRVVTTTSRQSIVFKLRGRSDAMLDTKGLDSPVLNQVMYIFPKPQTIGEWIIEELQGRDSVNFPGQDLENYKNMIVTPALNISIKENSM